MRTIVGVILGVVQTLCWAQEPRIFWTDKDDGQLEASDLDGGNRVTILSGLADPRGIVIDRTMEKLYWATRGGGGVIHVANLDGSEQSVFLSGLVDPGDLALDREARVLYWAEQGTEDDHNGTIKKKTLDGDELPQVVIGGLDEPYYLAVDPSEGFLYWSDFNSSVIHQATLAGANPINIVTGQARVRDVEVADGVLYWLDRNSSQVRRRAVDGTGSGDLLFSGGGMNRPHGLALDPEENMMYWTDTSARRISSGGMDGVGNASVIVSTSLGGAWAIEFWRPPVDPLQEWLDENFTSEELNDAGLENTVWGWNADPDEDGRENLLEYAQGTDPREASVDAIEVFVEGGELQVKFRFRKDDPSLQFEVESTFDLSAPSWDADEIGDEIIRTPDPSDSRFELIQVESDTITAQNPKLFVRLRVTQ